MTDTPPRAVFYTPLKHPWQPEASGDREIARGLMQGLRGCGFEPELASRLSTWRRAFNPKEAEWLERQAALIAAMLLRRYRRRPAERRPRVWLTYQNYHRCPDLLGPVVSTGLGIPYVLADTSVSSQGRRTAFRPWLSAARLALRRADLIFAMSPRDLPRLAELRGPRFAVERLRLLPPAVDLARFETSEARRLAYRDGVTRYFAGQDGPVLLCVAMMRVADKLDSYRLLAAALGMLHTTRPDRPWRLLVVGDGPARADVEAALAALPRDRVCLLGALDPSALPPLYLGADLFAFPGLGEEFGLVFLEAAAAGIPVVACQGPGPDFMVVPDGGVLTGATPEAFAGGLARLLDDPGGRQRMGHAARRFVATERTTEALERRLKDGLARLHLV
ncbi:MAG: glycosyltransferase family 4 protein [Candidatus Rokuibacteriota bacterium]